MTGGIYVSLGLPLPVLAGCSEKAPVRRYSMRGEIRAPDPPAHSAAIAAGKIGDWMEAMPMEYPVKPHTEFQRLRVCDRIEATVVVSDAAYYVTDVRVSPK